MPITLDSFRSTAASGILGTRAVLLNRPGQPDSRVALGHIGRCTVCQVQRDANNATMQAFREALRNDYGAVGTDVFREVLGKRLESSHALRVKDVRQVFGKLQQWQQASVRNEVQRQCETHPRLLGLSAGTRAEIMEAACRDALSRMEAEDTAPAAPAGGFSFRSIDRLSAAVSQAVARALENTAADSLVYDVTVPDTDAAATDRSVPLSQPTGLLRLNASGRADIGGRETSVEDRVRTGRFRSGMRLNFGSGRPMLFEKLKANGVEPGFICRDDWSAADTESMLKNLDAFDPSVEDSPARGELLSQAAALADTDSRVKDLLNGYGGFSGAPGVSDTARRRHDLCLIGCSVGRQNPAAMAFATELLVRSLLTVPLQGDSEAAMNSRCSPAYGRSPWAVPLRMDTLTPELKALREALGNRTDADFFSSGDAPRSGAQAAELKRFVSDNFTLIRDAVMHMPSEGPVKDAFGSLAVFRRFADRHIVKLDYNEGDRAGKLRSSRGSSGHFRLPERTKTKNAGFYRLVRLTTATRASAGAVAEALANDLTRILGVPAQEMSVVRGEYSDGRTKLMLDAKFANGYRDFDGVFLKDGRLTSAVGGSGKPETPEDIGRFKAAFLLLADRDAIGSHGQNKGLVNGKFFAIDPGHSLEGKGKQLEIHDDFSFRYTGNNRKYFMNYSVFDDSTRFEKFRGILTLDSMRKSGDAEKLFASYKSAFSETRMRGQDAELGRAVRGRVGEMEKEFNTQLNTMLETVFKPQLDFYHDITAWNKGLPSSEKQLSPEKAINTIENLEKETSPVTQFSKNGEVRLKHLEVAEGKRTAWTARMEGSSLVYESQGTVPEDARAHLTEVLSSKTLLPVNVDAATGKMRITVPADQADTFFGLMSEENVRSRRAADLIR